MEWESAALISRIMCSETHEEVLEDYLLLDTVDLARRKMDFPTGYCPNSQESVYETWFKSKNIQVLNRPSKNPDFSPIGNLSKELVLRIHSLGRQYTSSIKLRSVIEDECRGDFAS